MLWKGIIPLFEYVVLPSPLSTSVGYPFRYTPASTCCNTNWVPTTSTLLFVPISSSKSVRTLNSFLFGLLTSLMFRKKVLDCPGLVPICATGLSSSASSLQLISPPYCFVTGGLCDGSSPLTLYTFLWLIGRHLPWVLSFTLLYKGWFYEQFLMLWLKLEYLEQASGFHLYSAFTKSILVSRSLALPQDTQNSHPLWHTLVNFVFDIFAVNSSIPNGTPNRLSQDPIPSDVHSSLGITKLTQRGMVESLLSWVSNELFYSITTNILPAMKIIPPLRRDYQWTGLEILIKYPSPSHESLK